MGVLAADMITGILDLSVIFVFASLCYLKFNLADCFDTQIRDHQHGGTEDHGGPRRTTALLSFVKQHNCGSVV